MQPRRLFILFFILAAAALVATACEGVPADCFCNQTAVIVTTPLHDAAPYYIDVNQNKLNEDDEFAGIYPVYDWNKERTVTWQADPNEAVDAAHTAYRVSLFQVSFNDLIAAFNAGDFNINIAREIKVAHHWATNPNGRSFTFGAFGYGEDVCFDCPTVILVQPESYEQVLNPATGIYEYKYTPLPNALNQSSPAFIFERTPRE